MLIKARYVVPVTQPAIENGGVVIRDGIITEVGCANALHDSPAIDYGDAMIGPGFANAHTHLDLTHCNNLLPVSSGFVDWLRRLMAHKAKRPATEESIRSAAAAGLEASVRAGVTTLGDISATPAWTREVLSASGLRVVSFGEVIAIGARRCLLDERLAAAADVRQATARMRIGVSPHAPYTVEPDAMRACGELARRMNQPLCIHLAETEAESQFTTSRAGPFVDYLRTLGVWDDSIPTSGCGPIELAKRVGLLWSRTVIAHANYVDDADLGAIKESGASVVYCPRTHDTFRHAPHRFADMLAAGINVCIGTDSLASNPSLSILDELRFLRRAYPDFSVERVFEMGTLRGAGALGFSQTTGSLTPGKAADLVVIPLDASDAAAGWSGALDSETTPSVVYLDGRVREIDGQA